MTDGSVARRYAKALLGIALESGSVDRFGADLDKFLATSATGGNMLGDALCNPVFTLEERRAVLERVLPGLQLDKTVANFLRLLLDKRRIDGIAAIVREYRAFADTEANRVRATITSAEPLNAAELAEARRSLEATTGKTVILEAKIDRTLIGGVVAQVGSRVYDASIRSRLERLSLSLSDTRA